MTETWMRWVDIADRLLFQTFYRILGMVSMHGPPDEIWEAIKYLRETKRGGRLYWLIPKRWARWEDINLTPEIEPAVKMSVWIYFGKATKNVAYMRMGWWKLYFVDVAMRAIGTRVP